MRWSERKPSGDELRALIGGTIVVLVRAHPLRLAEGKLVEVGKGAHPDITVEIAGKSLVCPLQSAVDLVQEPPVTPRLL